MLITRRHDCTIGDMVSKLRVRNEWLGDVVCTLLHSVGKRAAFMVERSLRPDNESFIL